jgi:hypothetical protein
VNLGTEVVKQCQGVSLRQQFAGKTSTDETCSSANQYIQTLNTPNFENVLLMLLQRTMTGWYRL